MVNDVKIPEKPGFVTDPVKNVVGEVVNEKQEQPRPPDIR
jgi:hypothetical protein